MRTYYVVETLCSSGWERIWEEMFDTHGEARQAILDHVKECEEAVADGFLEDCQPIEDYRVTLL
jgi:hypothetical protein